MSRDTDLPEWAQTRIMNLERANWTTRRKYMDARATAARLELDQELERSRRTGEQSDRDYKIDRQRREINRLTAKVKELEGLLAQLHLPDFACTPDSTTKLIVREEKSTD